MGSGTLSRGRYYRKNKLLYNFLKEIGFTVAYKPAVKNKQEIEYMIVSAGKQISESSNEPMPRVKKN